MKEKYSSQLTAQMGEFLAGIELTKRGYRVRIFGGTFPGIDLLAIDKEGNQFSIQVKALSGNTLPSKADEFMDVKFDKDNRQIVKLKKNISNPNLIYLLIKLGDDYTKNEFYLLYKKDLFRIQYTYYRNWLKKYDNLRPNKPRSLHCSVYLKYLQQYKDNWKILKKEK